MTDNNGINSNKILDEIVNNHDKDKIWKENF